MKVGLGLWILHLAYGISLPGEARNTCIDVNIVVRIINITERHVFIVFCYTLYLTLYALMDSSFWFDTINLGWSIVYIEGTQVITSK